MSATEALRSCPVCNELYLQEGPRSLESHIGRERYSCQRCGTYDVDKHIVRSQDFDKVRHLVSAWIRRQNDTGIFPVVVGSGMNTRDIKWTQQFEYMGFPKTTGEKLDALLLAYANKKKYGEKVKLHDTPALISEVAAYDLQEVKGLTQLLGELEYVNPIVVADVNAGVRLKAKGWLRVDELRKTSVASDSAFIAMWFEDSVTGAYREAVIKAVEACNYKPVIVDQYEFNGFIMDQVVTLIRQSRFIIADFTCKSEKDDKNEPKTQCGVRGGVYWEAGFAYGLGKPVIHTCEDSAEAKRRIHFDVDQYKTIFWTNSELGAEIRDLKQNVETPNFMEKLAIRILSTVGKGSYVPEKK